jgi:methyl-accepting chemotaxis protein
MVDQKARPYQRRIVYIHKTFQRGFILKFCLIAFCAMSAASLLLYFFSKNSMTATYRYHHLALQQTGEAILPALIVTNLVVLLGLLFVTAVVTLYVSHKIGGPLYRLNKSLESIGRGDLASHLRLRQHDQLTELASGLNQMIQGLNDRVRRIQAEVKELREKVQGSAWDKEEIRGDTEKLHQTVHELFRTGE